MADTTQNTPAKTQPVSSMANFLNFPNTKKFLEENLKERRAEFVSNLISMCDSDATLAECDPKKLMMCALNATAINLPLNKNLGLAYVIAYKGVPSFQIGYKGFIQLSIRTGAYRTINACEIMEGEITRNKITGEIKFHGDKPGAPLVGYLAYLELMTGFSASLYMTVEQIEAHALQYSKTYAKDKREHTTKSKWSDPQERNKMARKTVLKGLLSTYGLMTTELETALATDDNDETGGFRSGGFDNYTDVTNQKDPVTPAPAAQKEPENAAGESKTIQI